MHAERAKIPSVQKITVVEENFSGPNNGRAIFSQTVIVNKSQGAIFSCSVRNIRPLC